MATGKSYYARPSYRFLQSDTPREVPSPPFELDESDFYNNNSDNSAEFSRKPGTTVSGSRLGKKQTKRADSVGGTPASVPVNIPDWSKILKDEYRDSRRRAAEDSDDDDGYGGGEDSVRVPPHEFLARQMARTRIVSFSVHEGVGRTLKGGDLTRVRNAIWEKTGFQD